MKRMMRWSRFAATAAAVAALDVDESRHQSIVRVQAAGEDDRSVPTCDFVLDLRAAQGSRAGWESDLVMCAWAAREEEASLGKLADSPECHDPGKCVDYRV